MRLQLRLTKYNPACRDLNGAYLLDDWTSFSDIGKSFAGKTLTEPEYLNVESKYLSALQDFLHEAGVDRLKLTALECQESGDIPAFVVAGRYLSVQECVVFAQLALRERVWGKLAIPGVAYVHFGYDFYMYLGLPRGCPSAVARAQGAGLFPEAFRSPYLRERSNPALRRTASPSAEL